MGMTKQQERGAKRILRPGSRAAAWASLLVILTSGVLWGLFGSLARADGCPNQQARSEEGWGRLPDCRAYELVSPTQKNGNQAGALQDSPTYSVASPEGEGLLYGSSGPIGSTSTGVDIFSVARRSSSEWTSSAMLPRSQGQVSFAADQLVAFDPSADLSHVLFSTQGSFAPGNPPGLSSQSLYLGGQEGSVLWVGEPRIPDPNPMLGHVEGDGLWPAGGSGSLGVVYFTYYGTLVPEDKMLNKEGDSRASHVRGEEPPGKSPWGFYEWRGGLLSNAGELPPAASNGPFDPYGAVPAAVLNQGFEDTPEEFDNEVSEDGSRAFFVSPDPTLDPEEKGAFRLGRAPELYVRETGADGRHNTVLVSRTELGQPATHGPLALARPSFLGFPSYVFASPDGSQAFFESTDRLTSKAPESPFPKEYDFDVETGTMTYLPEVTDGKGGYAAVLASSHDGSRFIFARQNEAGVPAELYLGLDSRITKIGQLPALPSSQRTTVDPVRATADGSAFVFETDAPIVSSSGGAFNNGGGYEQVYRYSVATEALSCVSCPPADVVPSGDASLSNDSNQPGPAQGNGKSHLVPTRGLSADGSRVFFDTPEALVPQDINGKRDVYEWENGNVFLISSGTGPEDSFFLDSGESGDDVFFATTDALRPADTDGGFDVYDARAPHEPNEVVGFPPPVSPAPCLSDCQGLPSAPPALGVPSGSATFSGAGNLALPVLKPPATHTPKKKPKHRASAKRRAKGSRRRGHRATRR